MLVLSKKQIADQSVCKYTKNNYPNYFINRFKKKKILISRMDCPNNNLKCIILNNWFSIPKKL